MALSEIGETKISELDMDKVDLKSNETPHSLEDITQASFSVYAMLRNSLAPLEKLEAQKKILQAREKSKPAPTVTEMKQRAKGDRISPDLRLTIGKEMLHYNMSPEDAAAKHNISKPNSPSKPLIACHLRGRKPLQSIKTTKTRRTNQR